MKGKLLWLALVLVCAASLSGCSAKSDAAGKPHVTLKIATVNNPDMKIMEQLSGQFEKKTGIHLDFVILPENAPCRSQNPAWCRPS